jgi:peptidylamidoglycolate lyase
MKIANPEDRRTTPQRLWVLLMGMILSVACATGSSGPSPTHSTSLELEISSDWPALAPGVTTGETSGVGIDSHGHVFVFHRGEGPSILGLSAEEGTVIVRFGEGLFENAHGLAIGPDDAIWVTDTRRHQVLRFSHAGVLELALGERGVAGTDLRHFDQPTDVAVTPEGEIYVSDGYGNNRVVKFAADGTPLLEWGRKGARPGEFNLPHGITLDEAGRVYVADRSNQRVQIFEGDGTFVSAWGEAVFGPGSRPWGLEFAHERLYVIDGGNMNPLSEDYARISVLDLEGRVLSQWSQYGEQPGSLSWGHDLAVGPDGAVYTAEVRHANRAQKFRVPSRRAEPEGP